MIKTTAPVKRRLQNHVARSTRSGFSRSPMSEIGVGWLARRQPRRKRGVLTKRRNRAASESDESARTGKVTLTVACQYRRMTTVSIATLTASNCFVAAIYYTGGHRNTCLAEADIQIQKCLALLHRYGADPPRHTSEEPASPGEGGGLFQL